MGGRRCWRWPRGWPCALKSAAKSPLLVFFSLSLSLWICASESLSTTHSFHFEVRARHPEVGVRATGALWVQKLWHVHLALGGVARRPAAVSVRHQRRGAGKHFCSVRRSVSVDLESPHRLCAAPLPRLSTDKTNNPPSLLPCSFSSVRPCVHCTGPAATALPHGSLLQLVRHQPPSHHRARRRRNRRGGSRRRCRGVRGVPLQLPALVLDHQAATRPPHRKFRALAWREAKGFFVCRC